MKTDFIGNPIFQNTGYLLFCIGGIILLIFIGILPNIRTLEKKDQEIISLNNNIIEHSILMPCYSNIINQSKNLKKIKGPTFRKTGLSQYETSTIDLILSQLIRVCDLEVSSIKPDIATFAGNSSSFNVRLVILGDFEGFHRLLIKVVELPYLKKIEQIRIQDDPETNHLQLCLNIWLLRSNKHGKA